MLKGTRDQKKAYYAGLRIKPELIKRDFFNVKRPTSTRYRIKSAY